ncbi:MAG TPA: hypothetical protein VFW46_10855 [Stellaceae bacterium]|nr:hypothetical protein [Stellaceae bacterium]
MSSFISSSDGRRWRRFLLTLVGMAVAAGVATYLFIVTVDPFDTLALSPALNRVPVASNARFAFPSLARSQRFDSAIFGTSTSRLLRPRELDPLLGTRFANLSMNSAEPYEQFRLLQVFARHHPDARMAMIGLDTPWCLTGDRYDKFTERVFPEWLYEADAAWRGYREMLSAYALTQAVQEFRILIGRKKQRYGSDGYTDFLPDDSLYDAGRAAALLPKPVQAGADDPSFDTTELRFPNHQFLSAALQALPAATRKLLFFPPYYVGGQPPAGTEAFARLRECKRRIAAIAAATPGTLVADFMIPSGITDDPTHYWDPLHYRVGIADRLGRDLADAAAGLPSRDGDYRAAPR